jgi:hypothetical protein
MSIARRFGKIGKVNGAAFFAWAWFLRVAMSHKNRARVEGRR